MWEMLLAGGRCLNKFETFRDLDFRLKTQRGKQHMATVGRCSECNGVLESAAGLTMAEPVNPALGQDKSPCPSLGVSWLFGAFLFYWLVGCFSSLMQ